VKVVVFSAMFFNEAVLSVLSIYGRFPLRRSHLERLTPDLGPTWLILPWVESVHGFALTVAGDFIGQVVYVVLSALL